LKLKAASKALRPELAQPKPQAYSTESSVVCCPGAISAELNNPDPGAKNCEQ